MRRWTAGLVLVLAMAPVAVAGGETPEPLTLEQAISIALEGNRQLAMADAGTVAAAESMTEARSFRQPRIDLIENVSWTTNPVYVFGNLLGQESFTAENFDVDFLNQPDALTNFQTLSLIHISEPTRLQV